VGHESAVAMAKWRDERSGKLRTAEILLRANKRL